MKKGVLILLILALAVCEWFTLNVRKDILSLEVDANEYYTLYSGNKSEYTLTDGTITDIIKNKSLTDVRYCFIEFTTSDGHTYTDRFFPCDTDNDKVGGTVEIAYKLRTAGTRKTADATRTEYIPSTVPLRMNRLFTIGIAAAIGVLIIWGILSGKKN